SATIDFVAQTFPELAGSGARAVDVDRLVEVVAREFGTTPADIASSRKQRHAVLGRHVVVYLATVVFDLRARRVVRHLGGLSPSTAAYARRKIELLRREDPIFDGRVKRLLEELDSGQKLLF
ncbi:MAG: helix-turn-helix domain-containing protein, partial [Planctomycetota bacterium JB042]